MLVVYTPISSCGWFMEPVKINFQLFSSVTAPPKFNFYYFSQSNLAILKTRKYEVNKKTFKKYKLEPKADWKCLKTISLLCITSGPWRQHQWWRSAWACCHGCVQQKTFQSSKYIFVAKSNQDYVVSGQQNGLLFHHRVNIPVKDQVSSRTVTE